MLVVAKDLALLEQAIHQRGLAVVNVRDDRDVANIAANPRGRLCFSHIHRLHGEARCPLLDPGHGQSTSSRSNNYHMCGHTRSDCTICFAVAALRRACGAHLARAPPRECALPQVCLVCYSVRAQGSWHVMVSPPHSSMIMPRPKPFESNPHPRK